MNLMIVPEDGTKLDVLAMRYRTAFDKTKAGRTTWVEGTLELATVIAEVKRQPKTSSPTDYGRWLERNGLRLISKNDLSALNNFAKDLSAARILLEQTQSFSWEQIWRTRPQRALPQSRKGTPPPLSRRSGSSLRKRALRIPTVMQHDDDEPAPKPVKYSEPRPEREAVVLRGLTREQVDPDFKGTTLEFATEYGHVNLHTKAEIEHNKRQEALTALLGAIADHERSGREMLAALTTIDPSVLREWQSKPGKAAKLQAWCKSIELACEKLRDIGKN